MNRLGKILTLGLEKKRAWQLPMIAGLLVLFGADPHVKDRNGWTPVRWAETQGHTKIAERLLPRPMATSGRRLVSTGCGRCTHRSPSTGAGPARGRP